MVQAIVTVPPHARFAGEVARHPLVSGLRLNTVMPIAGSLEETLERLAALGKTLFVDLKGRQLRVKEAALPPFTEVRLTHRLTVETPCRAYFSSGRESALVLAVEGDRLILEDGPRRVLGPGESVNIPEPSLEVEGVLTARDVEFVTTARALGLHDYMLSFVEREDDLDAVLALDPEARIVCKIESRKGLACAREAALPRLMAARGDLFLELAPHELPGAQREILARDPDAILASRLFSSLASALEPEAQDVTDAAFALALGFRTLLLGDEVCLRRESVISALNLLEALAGSSPSRGLS
jgi:pyruvate kinase